jgi:hypothetical protein
LNLIAHNCRTLQLVSVHFSSKNELTPKRRDGENPRRAFAGPAAPATADPGALAVGVFSPIERRWS